MTLLPRYILNLGFISGLVTFLKVEVLKLREFAFPPYTGTIHLRRDTTDIKVFREIFLFNIYSIDLPETPGVIVDAGANVGLSSIFFSHRFPSATIFSIEPEESNFSQLEKNIAQYPNIKAIRAGLWNRDAVLQIADPDEHHWAFRVGEANTEGVASFDGVSLNSLMMNNRLEKIDLLKIDIEGAEYELFSEGYEYWLSRTKTIVIELHDWYREGCSATFFKAIAQYRIKTRIGEGMLVIELNP